MNLKLSVQWHVVAILFAIVVLAFRGPAILEIPAWGQGRATTLGRTDDVVESWIKGRRLVQVRYSYDVAGVRYEGSDFGADGMLESVPIQVTYARSRPGVSTVFPEKIDPVIRTSVIVAVVALLPPVLMWLFELVNFLKGASKARASSD